MCRSEENALIQQNLLEEKKGVLNIACLCKLSHLNKYMNVKMGSQQVELRAVVLGTGLPLAREFYIDAQLYIVRLFRAQLAP
jgi:hypothetical protein